MVHMMRSWFRIRQGEYDLAPADLAHMQRRDWYWYKIFYPIIQMELALNSGQCEQAVSLAEQTIAAVTAKGDLWGEGSAQRVWAQALATLEPSAWTAVDLHFAESLRAFDEGGARLDAAHTHVAWGKTLAQRGEKQPADEHFAIAAAQFATSGLTRELAEVQKLIGGVTSSGRQAPLNSRRLPSG